MATTLQHETPPAETFTAVMRWHHAGPDDTCPSIDDLFVGIAGSLVALQIQLDALTARLYGPADANGGNDGDVVILGRDVEHLMGYAVVTTP